MSKSAPWKATERRHAKRMGGKRLWRPDYGESAPDGESAGDVWDTKYRQEFSVVAMFLEAERKYKGWAPDKRFHLCLHDARHNGDFVLVRADVYADLAQTR